MYILYILHPFVTDSNVFKSIKSYLASSATDSETFDPSLALVSMNKAPYSWKKVNECDYFFPETKHVIEKNGYPAQNE